MSVARSDYIWTSGYIEVDSMGSTSVLAHPAGLWTYPAQ